MAYSELICELVIRIDNPPYVPVFIELPVFLKHFQEADQVFELWQGVSPLDFYRYCATELRVEGCPLKVDHVLLLGMWKLF